MAGEVELERLVVRLLGDAEQYKRMLDEQAAATKSFADKVQGQLAGAVTALGAGSLLKEGLANWQEAEDIGIRLSAVLQANGRDVEETAERYDKFAKQLEKTTTLEDDQVLSLLALAESYDLTNEKAERAIQDAHAIAAINGGVAESYLRIAAAMQEGDLEKAMHMARMIPQLRGIKDEAEFVAKFMKLTAAGMIAAEKAAQSSSGQMKTLKRDFGNLLEEGGAITARWVKPIVLGLQGTVEWVRAWGEEAKTAAVGVLTLAAASGTLATVFGAAAFANPFTWVAAAAAGFYVLGQSIAAGAIKELEEAQKQADGLARKLEKIHTTRIEKVITETKDLAPGDRKQALEGVMDTATKELKDYEERLEATKKKLAEIRSGWDLMLEEGAVTERLREDQKMFDITKAKVAQLKAALDALAVDPKTEMTKRAKSDLDDLTKSLRLQVQTFGMSEGAAALYKLQLEHGLTPAQTRNAEGLVQMKQAADAMKKSQEEAAEATQRLHDNARDMATEMESQIATFGMSTEAARIFKLEMEGLDEAIAWHLRGLAEEKERLDAVKKAMEEGTRMTERIIGKDPLANFQKEMADLQRLFDEGHVTEEIYRMGIKQLEEEFQKAGKTADKMGGKFDQALSNSADARQRIQQFYDALDRRNTKRPTADAGRFDQAARGGAEAAQREEKQVNKLEDIRKLMQQQVNRPVLVVEGANL